MAADRPLRADAARNADRILRAARQVYAELGPDAPAEAVARRAGVGERTLYRRFPARGLLVRAALDQAVAEDLAPAIESARDTDDPLETLAGLIDAAISLGAREHHLLAAARKAGSLTADISDELFAVMAEVLARAQDAGQVRADLVADDLPRFVAMLFSVLGTMEVAGDGWRRYAALLLDGITTGPHRALPTAADLLYAPAATWPI